MENKDFKYVIQDFSTIYLGAKYTYEEMIEAEEVSFKLKSIFQQHILKEIEPDVSLESHFYYMEPKGFVYQVYKQLSVKVKVAEIEEKKSLFGKKKEKYVSNIYRLEEFVKMPIEEKKKRGIVVSEISLSKLALMGFSL